MDLVEFLTARLAEDALCAEEATYSSASGVWTFEGGSFKCGGRPFILDEDGSEPDEDAWLFDGWELEHVARHDPARVLAEVAAKRRRGRGRDHRERRRDRGQEVVVVHGANVARDSGDQGDWRVPSEPNRAGGIFMAMRRHQPVEFRRSLRERYRLQIHIVVSAVGVAAGIIAGYFTIPGHGAQAPYRLNITNAATSAP